MMKILNRVLTVIVVAVIFYFLIRSLVVNWNKIPFAQLRFDAGYVIVSFLFLFAYFLLLTQGWSRIVAELDGTLPYRKALYIMSTSQIAKYLPGGIWYTLGRVYLGKTAKIREEIGLLSVIFETFLLMLTDLVIFLVAINFLGSKTVLSPMLSVIFIVIILVLLYPPLLNALLNIALKLLRRPRVTLKVKYINILKLSAYFFAVWICQIAGFYALINSIYPLTPAQIPSITAAYTLSWITGFIVLFAPGGLGVREGMMSILLAPVLPSPLAIVISFITRIWITFFELVMFFIGLATKRQDRK
jgi:uncharacterized membrane protein YbhN (UPF0104 family)